MPNYNGTGPYGAGPKTGRGLGPCCGAQAYGRGMRRGGGFGMGAGGMGRGVGFGASLGRGMGGFGPRMGWYTAGYGTEDQEVREAGIKSTLEQRAAFLRAELEHTESLLKNQGTEAEEKGSESKK